MTRASRRLRILALLPLAMVTALAPATFAQDASRKELRRVDLSGAPGMEVILSVTELKPGDEIPEHIHHGIETGYVLEGGTFGASIRVQVKVVEFFEWRD